jgi:large subunit ribosomal protein L16
MALVPKRVKFRKTQRGSRKGFATRCITLAFGAFGLQSLDRCWLTNIQIEAARVALTRNMNRKGKLWIRPPETRMGKGKGQPEFWVAVIKPGTILFELDGLLEADAKECFRLAASKLPMATRFITRERKLVF